MITIVTITIVLAIVIGEVQAALVKMAVGNETIQSATLVYVVEGNLDLGILMTISMIVHENANDLRSKRNAERATVEVVLVEEQLSVQGHS